MTPEEKLAELGIVLPEAPPAVAAYVPWVVTETIVMTSGQLPFRDGVIVYAGKVGLELSEEDGAAAAKLCAINALSQIKAALGELSRVKQIVRLEGNVHSAARFQGQPKVLNGASELMSDVFGEQGRHTRTALGIFEMPLNAAVQLSVFATVRD